MVIVSRVTPCCWAATGIATASSAAAAASSSLFMVLLLWPVSALGKVIEQITAFIVRGLGFE
jgi:hypothetical protein